ncbi:MAG TPA: MYXO-CTERM sorting domain-containing protein, partial [Candidatus Dormibacteraeota bacterium]|nr:MYXO-CTERM sorting domain-containing protein [Candidatus Dormibacteraeota bacterium]
PAADATAPPTPADTATAAVPTKVPPTKAPASTPTAPHPTPTAERGWFGCQIADGASAAPPLALALLLAALAGVRRRRPPQR